MRDDSHLSVSLFLFLSSNHFPFLRLVGQDKGALTLFHPLRVPFRSASAIQSCRPPSPNSRIVLRSLAGTGTPANSLSPADLHDFNSFICPSSIEEPATLNPPDPHFYDLLPDGNSVSVDTGTYPSLSTFPQATDQFYADTSTALPADLNLNLPYDHSIPPPFATASVPPFVSGQGLFGPTESNQSSWFDLTSNQLDFNQYSFPTDESLNSSSLDTPQSASPNSLLQNSFSSNSFNCTVGNDTGPTRPARIDPSTAVTPVTGSAEGSSNEQPPAVDDAAEKRRRNTLAARRFRKKQQDRVTRLEEALGKVTKERDDLKMRAARSEGEVAALRKMIAEKN